jgi:hypothetical protein
VNLITALIVRSCPVLAGGWQPILSVWTGGCLSLRQPSLDEGQGRNMI